jgi:hypothetical protein
MMTVVDVAGVQAAGKRLEALAGDLTARGFTAHPITNGQVPGVRVINPVVTRLSEDVWAAPADDASWWFWWSWAERITQVEDVATAAARIAHVLTPCHG